MAANIRGVIFMCSMQPSSPLNLGFACAWDADRRRTWSHTPLSLFEALQRRADVRVVDVPMHVSPLAIAVARLLYIRRLHGRFVSGWRYSPLSAAAHERAFVKAVQRAPGLDAVLSIGEHGIATTPTFFYQDHSFSHAVATMRESGMVLPSFESYSEEMLQTRVARERASFRKAAGVISMSAWNARFLVERGLVSEDRVHVVPPGIHVAVAPPSAERALPRGERTERRVVFIGRDWHRKAGDVVLRAIRALLPSALFPIRFIVAGPQEWPEDGSIPEWVDFLGDASHERLRAELATADVFAMPSRFEAYGIAPLEALAAGVPVLARNAYAMAEYVRHGDNGMLIESDDADACAAALLHILTDDAMRRRVAEQASDVAAYYSWDRAAADIVRITSGVR